MSQIKKFFISALTVLLIATLLISAVLLSKQTKSVYAYNVEHAATVNEIWQGGKKPFNGENLISLYGQLVDGATKYEEVKKAVDDNTLVSNSVAGKKIIIKFGGMNWLAVYISKATTEYAEPDDSNSYEGVNDIAPNLGKAARNDIVLTLWLAHVPNEGKYKAQWNKSYDSNDGTYPSNMYGTSYIRSQVLNNGGKYWKDIDTLVETESEISQKTSNTYAKFTMGTDGEQDIADYLVAPRYIDWQYSQSSKETGGYYNLDLNNDAWGTDVQANFNDKGQTYYYRGKTGYTAWKDDLLWLPSLAETGGYNYSVGIWNTVSEQRLNESNAWLRSGNTGSGGSAFYLSTSVESVANSYLVRPALHLNLTAAAGAASGISPTKPTGDQLTKEFDFNGTEQTFTLPDFGDVTYTAQGSDISWWNGESDTITATNAGEYKVEIAPPEAGWKEGGNDPVTFTFKINKAKIGEEWKTGFAQSQEFTYHSDQSHAQTLCLPDITDGKFPLSLVGKPSLSAGDITIKYIITTHEESQHSDSEIQKFLNDLKDGEHSTEWKDYSAADTSFKAIDPGGYCVYFKAEAGDNFETLYDFYSVHIFSEKLTIKLKNPSKHSAEIEYGDIAHTQTALRTAILGDIPETNGIVVLGEDGIEIKEDRTADFIRNSSNFEFYFRDSVDTVSGKEYKVDDSGNMRLAAGKTYYLFVKYLGEAGVDGSQNYITFEWGDSANSQRPSVTVKKRKVKLTLSSAGHTYGNTPAAITAEASRDGSGNWWGSAAITAPDVKTELSLTYKVKKSDDTGNELAIDSSLGAGIYNIIPTCGNDNYEISEYSGTYTVAKAKYVITGYNDYETSYTGEEISHEIEGLPDWIVPTYAYKGKSGTDTVYDSATAPQDVGEYEVTVTFSGENDNYDLPDTVTKYLTITPKELTFSLKNSSGEYTGEEHDGIDVDFETLAVGDSLTKGVDYDLSFAVDGEGELGIGGLPQGKGSYTVTVILKDTVKNYVMADGAEATYTIGIGGLAKPTGDDVNETYDGKVHTLTLSGFDKETMSGSASAGAEFNENTGEFTATNAGTYTLDITIRKTDEYQWTGDGKTQFTITINKKSLTVTAKDKTITYGDGPAGAGVECDGFAEGESESNLSGTLDYDFNYAQGGNVGNSYKITPKGYTSDNYNIEFKDGTLTVTPKPITLKINDGGHTHGSAPQSSFTLTDVNGGLVAGDTTAVFDGLITFYIKSNGVRTALDSSLEVGEYELCADNGDYGNYTVTFTNGVYTVSNDSITAPTADPNADNFVYTGDELTYMPEGFDPLTMDFEGNENVQTDAGEYTVKVYPKNRELVFETAEGPKDHLEFKFEIKPAEIVELNDNGNSFIQDEVTGGGEAPFAVTLGKKKNGKFANFDTVADQDITIYATLPMPYDGGEKPARPEFALGGEDYIDITELDIDDPDYPLNVDVKKVGKYVVYYHIVAPNHEDLDGEWRVEVAKDSEVVKVVFKKAYEIPYGVTPDPEEIFEDIKDMPAQYLSVTKGGVDFTKTFFDEIAQGVSLGCRRINEFGKYSDSGEYYINFKLDENSVYTVIYREGGNNPDDDTNFDKLKITQRELALNWDSSKLKYTFTGETIALDGLASLDMSNVADDWNELQVRFELSDHSQVITAEGEYQVTAVLVGANAKNYRFADEERVTNTVVVSAPLPDEPSPQTDENDGIPWWVWLIVGVGAALIITAIIIVIVVMKKKKEKEDKVEAQTAPAEAEPKIIYRDINSDDDGFYDDVDDGKK